MRNVLSFYILFYIGFVSGLIFPSSSSEFFDKDNAILSQNEEEQKVSSDIIKELNLNFLKLQDSLEEKALYEQSNTKKNNLTERSYVYISQRYKNPRFNSQFLNGNIEPVRMQQPVSIKYATRAHKRVYVNFDTPIAGFIDPYINSKEFFSNQYEIHNINERTNNERNQIAPSERTSNEQEQLQEYIKLLKPPVLRSFVQNNEVKSKTKDKINTTPGTPNFENKIAANRFYVRSRKVYNTPVTPPDILHSVENNYGFLPPSSKISHVKFPSDMGEQFHDEVIKDRLQVSKDVKEDFKLMDPLKHTVDDTEKNNFINLHEKYLGFKRDCNSKDCVLKKNKVNYLSNRNFAGCKCNGNTYDQKTVEDNEIKSNKEGESLVSSNDNEFEEALAEFDNTNTITEEEEKLTKNVLRNVLKNRLFKD